jgi:citrate synthase
VPKVDQRGFNNQHEEFLDSRRAAAFLGVQARTLYAYASRGLVARLRTGRSSRYARADLERLKARHDARSGHGPVAGGALHWGEPVLPTRISAVGPDGPRYRGHSATALARQGTPFPEVCELLWSGRLAAPAAIGPSVGVGHPDGRSPTVTPTPTGRSGVGRARAAKDTDPVLRLMAVAMAGLRLSSAPFGLAPEVERGRARGLVLAFAAAAGPRRPSTTSLDPATRLLASFGVPLSPARRRLADAALVLCADHELNASTFAARVAASTGADLQACLVAALATFLGPRHGTASRAVEEVLDEVGRPGRAEAVVRARTTRGEGMPGFGHALYPDGDPRATTLLALVAEAPSTPRLRTLNALIAATARVRGERPNIDAALLAACLALGLPRGAAVALFAVGRTAGWVAHVLEQRESPAVLRPRARYVGPTPG